MLQQAKVVKGLVIDALALIFSRPPKASVAPPPWSTPSFD